jgi:hypothetical protein
MGISVALARRSFREWVFRSGLAVAAALLGYLSVATTLAYSVVGSDPERAHLLAPWDGRITALLARSIASRADAKPVDRSAADQLARKALRQEPINIVAATTLALDAIARGDRSNLKTQLTYAESLSRRDLQTELLAVEQAVSEGNVSGALRHYDIALRTSREAPGLLFPILGAAIADPTVRVAMVRTLSRRPAWWGSFLDYVSGNGPDPRATASMMLALRRTHTPIPTSADATIISLLAQRDGIEPAWRYYAATRRDANVDRSRDPAFAINPTPPSLFDWIAINDGNVSVSIQPGAVDFSTPAGISGLLLQQVEMLSPGTYRLQGVSAGIDQPSEALPYWALACRGGRELGRVVLPSSSSDHGLFSGSFVVPPECSVQTLSLVARATDSVSGLSGRIERVALRPASR